jgi:hypothetical protein
MNAFELSTKGSPRRLGVHAWEKYLTSDEFQELSACRDNVERAEIQLEEHFLPSLVQVFRNLGILIRSPLSLRFISRV